jgi:hypothetical protein
LAPAIRTDVPDCPETGAKIVIDGPTGVAVTVNEAALVAVPPGVVTLILPVVAPLGTVAVMDVADAMPNEQVVPFSLTAVAPVKFVPVIVTFVPTGPLAGVKDVIVGAGVVTVNDAELVAVPPGAVMLIVPVVAPAGTAAVMEVADAIANVVAAVPLNLTADVPDRFVPVIVTTVPGGPLVGVNDVIVGRAVLVVTVKDVALVAVPPEVVTLIRPVVAPAGTVVVMVFA